MLKTNNLYVFLSLIMSLNSNFIFAMESEDNSRETFDMLFPSNSSNNTTQNGKKISQAFYDLIKLFLRFKDDNIERSKTVRLIDNHLQFNEEELLNFALIKDNKKLTTCNLWPDPSNMKGILYLVIKNGYSENVDDPLDLIRILLDHIENTAIVNSKYLTTIQIKIPYKSFQQKDLKEYFTIAATPLIKVNFLEFFMLNPIIKSTLEAADYKLNPVDAIYQTQKYKDYLKGGIALFKSKGLTTYNVDNYVSQRMETCSGYIVNPKTDEQSKKRDYIFKECEASQRHLIEGMEHVAKQLNYTDLFLLLEDKSRSTDIIEKLIKDDENLLKQLKNDEAIDARNSVLFIGAVSVGVMSYFYLLYKKYKKAKATVEAKKKAKKEKEDRERLMQSIANEDSKSSSSHGTKNKLGLEIKN